VPGCPASSRSRSRRTPAPARGAARGAR
jgi:hypothetical protein